MIFTVTYKSGRVLGVSSPGFGLGGGTGDENYYGRGLVLSRGKRLVQGHISLK